MRDADLTASGWTLKGSNTLCASCQEEGWHFPADVAVPFRRVDAGSHS
jgi:hypothetical protein